MKRYTINQISKYLGISGEMLRHYERLGIIAPQRRENGYRTYSALDVSVIMRMQYYHSCGFSLKECGAMINDMELEDLACVLEKERDVIQLRARRAALIAEEYDRIVRRMCDVRQALGAVSISECPAMAMLPYRESDRLLEYANMREMLPLWLDAMPCANAGACFELADVRSGRNRYIFGLVIERRFMDLFGIEAVSPVRLIESRACATTVLMIEGNQPIHISALQPLTDYAKENGYEPDGDIYGRALTVTQASGVRRRYHQLWMPIRRK